MLHATVQNLGNFLKWLLFAYNHLRIVYVCIQSKCMTEFYVMMLASTAFHYTDKHTYIRLQEPDSWFTWYFLSLNNWMWPQIDDCFGKFASWVRINDCTAVNTTDTWSQDHFIALWTLSFLIVALRCQPHPHFCWTFLVPSIYSLGTL